MSDADARRERVLDAAARVYGERSIARAGRRDVAKAADVSSRAVS